MVNVYIPRERRGGETRVAATPETVRKMVKAGLAVTVEQGAGANAFFPDAEYATAGARVTDDPGGAAQAASLADAILTVTAPGADQVTSWKPGGLLIGFLAPHRNPDLARALAERKITSLAMELVPRVTRAQPMDALSSQANIAGYKAVLLAALRLPKYFPLLMTAAGTIKPARVVVMGAGVAGLQAIATARRLGAIVEVSDIRPAVKEQVQSLGGRFIELPMAGESGEGAGGYAREMGEDFLRRQREIVQRHVSQADAVITTALVPGKPAPRLVSREMVEAMAPGSVVVDLAVEQGGNCELSEADREVVHNGVLILGPSNLAASMPHDASSLYARNVLSLLLLLWQDGRLAVDAQDEVVAGSLLTHEGRVVHAATAELLQPQSVA
jgi:proton-translocating NAD(P)+ transhydrogenase subunit alpha